METVAITNELNIGQYSHEGMSGKANEDSLGVFAWNHDNRNKLILGVVADGVGGQIAGEVASRLAVETVENYFNALPRIDNINNHLEEAIVAANKVVYQASRDNPDYRGMSTTMAITAIIDDHIFTAHVGDSRIYLYRDGRLRQISVDHTWAQEAIEAGLLTPDQAKKHPNRNVIRRHLGGAMEVEVDHRLALEPGQSAVAARANQGMVMREGDTLLICSDGLTDMITDQAVLESLYNHYFDLEACANELIVKANQAGGKDNITVVILQAPPKGPPPIAPAAAPIVATAAATTTAAPVAATTAAAAAVPATAQAAAAPLPAKQGRSGGTAALLLIGGAVIIFVIALIAGGIFLIGGLGGDNETPEGTAVPGILPEGATFEPGAPATAAFLTTESGGLGTEEGVSPLDTPELIPTLRLTLAALVTRPAVNSQDTETPTATSTNRPTSGGGPAAPTRTSRPLNTAQPTITQPPPPTNTAQPTITQPPPPTNTQAPPPTDTAAPQATIAPPPTAPPVDS